MARFLKRELHAYKEERMICFCFRPAARRGMSVALIKSQRNWERLRRSGILKEITLKTSVLITDHFSCKITWSLHNPPTNHLQLIASVHTESQESDVWNSEEGQFKKTGQRAVSWRTRRCTKAPGVTPLEELVWWHQGAFLTHGHLF